MFVRCDIHVDCDKDVMCHILPTWDPTPWSRAVILVQSEVKEEMKDAPIFREISLLHFWPWTLCLGAKVLCFWNFNFLHR